MLPSSQNKYSHIHNPRPSQTSLFDSVQFFSRNKRIVIYFYSLAFIALFTYSPLFLCHHPAAPVIPIVFSPSCLIHSSLQFTVSPHAAPIYISAGSISVLSAATSSSPDFPLLLPKSFSNRSTSSHPSAVQVPLKALVLKRGWRLFPSHGSR